MNKLHSDNIPRRRASVRVGNRTQSLIRVLIRQCGHLVDEAQLCTASLTPSGAAPAFRPGDPLGCCWSGILPLHPPSHPTIGHRYHF
ncbi:unnamed protein product [Linum tenue]|uniref:Uncharacterized protein n=1 Tax=Linum tenue TaxID=586396 RepID=A0AAV0M1S6_9ROSI|nr:unnamed protein product [Linum tenue]